MIVEEREYKIKVGKIQEFWELYSTKGLPIQLKYQKKPKGFFSIQIGSTTNFVHMWEYNSLCHMEQCKNDLHADKKWNEYIKESHNYIDSMTTRILKELN